MLERIERFKLEHTYNEVVVHDGYRLKNLKFVPDTIYDIGANRGISTVWEQHLFPDATIIAVEPDPETFALLSEVTAGMPHVVRVQAALGTPPIYFRAGKNSGGNAYKSIAPGYPLSCLKHLPQVDVRAVTLAEIIEHYQDGGGPSMVKIDIEGGEVTLLTDSASTDVLRAVDYIAMELHFWAAGKDLIDSTAAAIMAWVGGFRHTHEIDLWALRNGGMAWMTRRATR